MGEQYACCYYQNGKGITVEQNKSSSGNLQDNPDTPGAELGIITMMIEEPDRDNIGKSGKMLSKGAHTQVPIEKAGIGPIFRI
jgi:hypothetical protein